MDGRSAVRVQEGISEWDDRKQHQQVQQDCCTKWWQGTVLRCTAFETGSSSEYSRV